MYEESILFAEETELEQPENRLAVVPRGEVAENGRATRGAPHPSRHVLFDL